VAGREPAQRVEALTAKLLDGAVKDSASHNSASKDRGGRFDLWLEEAPGPG
jgi:hypothetical protein